MKNAPKNLSKKMAIKLFRDHWERIADFFESRKVCGKIGLFTAKVFGLMEQGYYADSLEGYEDCWLCYYADEICVKCPIKWSKDQPENWVEDFCCADDSPFEALRNCKSWKKSAELARIISKLPEIK